MVSILTNEVEIVGSLKNRLMLENLKNNLIKCVFLEAIGL